MERMMESPAIGLATSKKKVNTKITMINDNDDDDDNDDF